MIRNKKIILILVSVLVLSLTLFGCTQGVEEDLDTAGDKIEDATDKTAEKVDDALDDAEEKIREVNYEDIKISPEEAFDSFLKLHPDAKVVEFDLDKDLMDYKYVIEGYDMENDYEVKIDAVDGEIIKDEIEVFDSDGKTLEITKAHLAKIDSFIEMAKLEDGSNSEFDEWSISIDDNRIEIEIEIGTKDYTYDMDTEELIEKD